MSINHSSQITTNGLVFYYDMKNYKSFWGEPTTNLSYNNGQGGSEYLAASYTWTNSGTWTLITDETDVSPPAIPYSKYLPKNLRIISGMTLTVGSQHFGCGFTTISPSTQYTFSVWFMQNRAGCSAPYLRTNVNNNSLGNFAYNGNTDSSTWPVNQWIRISCTGTTQANENGLYLSNYIGYSIGDKIWYYGHQLEAKSYPTSLVAGTRSNTQTIVDLMGQNTITATSLTYASNNTFSFDAVDDYIDSVTSSGLTGVGAWTIESWFKVNGTPSNATYGNVIVDTDATGGSANMIVVDYGGGHGGSQNQILYATRPSTGGGYTILGGPIITQGVYYNVSVVRNGNTDTKIYVNGSLYNTYSGNMPTATQPLVRIGRWSDATVYSNTMIPIVRIYNRGLSSNEVLQNFNAQRGIYGI